MGFLSSNSYFGQYIWVRHLQALRCLKPSWGQTPRKKVTLLWFCPYPLHTKSSSTNIKASLVSPFCYWNYTTAWQGGHWMYAQYFREVHPDILQPTIPRSVSFSESNSELCWELRGLLKELCSHWSCINPLIILVTRSILFPLHTFAIIFYTSCISGVLWGPFINT